MAPTLLFRQILRSRQMVSLPVTYLNLNWQAIELEVAFMQQTPFCVELQIYANFWQCRIVKNKPDSKVTRFNQMKTLHGFPKLISHETFGDASSGYTLDDCCVFGAEVYVIRNDKRKLETLSWSTLRSADRYYAWTLNGFSNLDKESYVSPVFSAGGKKWELEAFPRGRRREGKHLSVYLHMVDSRSYFNFDFLRWFRKDDDGATFLHQGDIYAESMIIVRGRSDSNRYRSVKEANRHDNDKPEYDSAVGAESKEEQTWVFLRVGVERRQPLEDERFRVFLRVGAERKSTADANGKVRRFTEMKTEHGFAKLISLATFRDNANGYLVCDTCLFGAEVFVIQNTKRAMSCISMERSEYSSSPVSWKVHNFSKLNHRRILELFPRGDESHKGKLSIYLHMVDSTTSFGYNYVRDWWFGRDRISTRWPWDGGVLGEFTVRVIDQVHGAHRQRRIRQSSNSRNWSLEICQFMPLDDLTNQVNGFLLDDTLIVEVDYAVLFEVKTKLRG
ncbi:hypothetical protein RJ640_019902 [Escallonia rubra]|uniref:MATH domain-containing protein n=1 Tax=Escallonia rubra TaxID=112253 RepID=A0AA88RK24_9ASTE|nr:hypothetical protein RJ640_019902 [Escallonia rubra]